MNEISKWAVSYILSFVLYIGSTLIIDKTVEVLKIENYNKNLSYLFGFLLVILILWCITVIKKG